MSFSTGDMRELIRQVLKEMQPTAPDESKIDYVSHVANCPECYKRAVEAVNNNSEYFCADCGLPLGSAEWAKKLENCPSCHSKNARQKRRE